MKKQFTEKDPFTTKDLFDMNPDTIFAKGESVDSPEGINMMNTGQDLKWIAKKGGTDDWCIYCCSKQLTDLHLLRMGNKVTGTENIKKCVPCTDDVLTRYRY